jgi:hypothetical protein
MRGVPPAPASNPRRGRSQPQRRSQMKPERVQQAGGPHSRSAISSREGPYAVAARSGRRCGFLIMRPVPRDLRSRGLTVDGDGGPAAPSVVSESIPRRYPLPGLVQSRARPRRESLTMVMVVEERCAPVRSGPARSGLRAGLLVFVGLGGAPGGPAGRGQDGTWVSARQIQHSGHSSSPSSSQRQSRGSSRGTGPDTAPGRRSGRGR